MYPNFTQKTHQKLHVTRPVGEGLDSRSDPRGSAWGDKTGGGFHGGKTRFAKMFNRFGSINSIQLTRWNLVQVARSICFCCMFYLCCSCVIVWRGLASCYTKCIFIMPIIWWPHAVLVVLLSWWTFHAFFMEPNPGTVWANWCGEAYRRVDDSKGGFGGAEGFRLSAWYVPFWCVCVWMEFKSRNSKYWKMLALNDMFFHINASQCADSSDIDRFWLVELLSWI